MGEKCGMLCVCVCVFISCQGRTVAWNDRMLFWQYMLQLGCKHHYAAHCSAAAHVRCTWYCIALPVSRNKRLTFFVTVSECCSGCYSILKISCLITASVRWNVCQLLHILRNVYTAKLVQLHPSALSLFLFFIHCKDDTVVITHFSKYINYSFFYSVLSC